MISEWVWLVLADAFWSAVVATGYAVLFNVPVRLVPGCALAGALGHLLRTLLLQTDISIEVATLVGATAVGFLGSTLARRWKAPTVVFTVAGVIPMAPGTFAYRTMLGVIELAGLADAAAGEAALWMVSYNATKTILILGALAVGIAAPTLLFRRHKPVV